FRIERARRLIEEQDRRIAQDRPANGDALALATRKRDAAFADFGVIAFRQGLSEFLDMSGARRRLDFGERCFGPAEADIVENAAGEDDRILRHDGDARSDLARIGRPHIDAVDEDAARLRIVETLQKGEDGGFAGARGAYQGDCFARRYGEVHRFERGPLRPCRIMEVDLVEGDLAQGW